MRSSKLDTYFDLTVLLLLNIGFGQTLFSERPIEHLLIKSQAQFKTETNKIPLLTGSCQPCVCVITICYVGFEIIILFDSC